jgi:hypothetical protein
MRKLAHNFSKSIFRKFTETRSHIKFTNKKIEENSKPYAEDMGYLDKNNKIDNLILNDLNKHNQQNQQNQQMNNLDSNSKEKFTKK